MQFSESFEYRLMNMLQTGCTVSSCGRPTWTFTSVRTPTLAKKRMVMGRQLLHKHWKRDWVSIWPSLGKRSSARHFYPSPRKRPPLLPLQHLQVSQPLDRFSSFPCLEFAFQIIYSFAKRHCCNRMLNPLS